MAQKVFEVRESTTVGELVCKVQLNSDWFPDDKWPTIIQLPVGTLAYRYNDVYVVELGYYIMTSDIVVEGQ